MRGIRVRDAPLDGIQIANSAYNVVIDHVSISGSGDGNLDITESSHDVTVSWSILAAPASDKNMLIKYNASRISLHHNLFTQSDAAQSDREHRRRRHARRPTPRSTSGTTSSGTGASASAS